MEDTLRDNFSVTGYICKDAVLILVLMEDTLRESFNDFYKSVYAVLILVLMEDTLREYLKMLV